MTHKGETDIKLVILVLAITFFDIESKRFHSFAGPYRVLVRRIEKCSDQLTAEEPIQYFLQDLRKKYTEDFTFKGNLTIPRYFDDKLDVRVKFSSWSNVAGWKENAFVFNMKKACHTAMQFVRPIWVSLMEDIFGEILYCPFYPGIYRVERIKFDFRKTPTKQFFYGRWRVDAHVLLESKVFGCLRIFSDTLPD